MRMLESEKAERLDHFSADFKNPVDEFKCIQQI
jgi:hypothetical protein